MAYDAYYDGEVLGDFGTLRIEIDLVNVGDAKYGPQSSYVPSRTSFWLNDEPISEDEGHRLLAEARAATA